MKLKKAKIDSIYGTSLQGFVDVSYAKLVEIFGEPHHDGDGYKVDAEWVLKFEDGTIATIYNYKTGKNYNGDEDGLAVEDITDWHVGGNSSKAALYVAGVVGVNHSRT